MTPHEAAFLAAVDPSRVRTWIDAGLVESVPVFSGRRDPGLTLVRAGDIAWALDHEDRAQTAPAAPTTRRRRPFRWYLRAVVGAALLLVWANAVRPAFVAAPASGDRTGSSVPVTIAPAPSDAVPGTVTVRWVGFVREGERFDVAAEVANHDPRHWFPAGDAAFVFRDASGEVLSTTSVPLSIGPGRERTLIANGIDLGAVPAEDVTSVDLVPSLPPPLPRARFDPPTIRLSRLSLERTRKTTTAVGRAANEGPQRHVLTIACALRSPGGELAQVASITLGTVRAGRTIPFEVPFPHADVRNGTVACTSIG